MSKKITIVVFLLFTIFIKYSYASTIEVYPGERIQDAIEQAVPGDTVFVYRGTYPEDIVMKNGVDLIGESHTAVLIKGNIFFKDAACTLGDVTIAFPEGGFLSYKNIYYDDWRLQNDAGITAINSTAIIQNCIIIPDLETINNSHPQTPDLEYYGYGIQVWNMYNNPEIYPRIENNIIKDTECGIYYFSQAFGGVISGQIKNNTFYHNKNGVVLRMHKEKPEIKNNIITGGGVSLFIAYQNGSLFDQRKAFVHHNDIWDAIYKYWLDEEGLEFDLTGINGNISANPGYNNPDSYDFAYPLFSPCWGAADDGGNMGAQLSAPATPSAPQVEPLPPATNQQLITIEGTKDANTSIVINGEEYVGINGETTWTVSSYDLGTDGDKILLIYSKNIYGRESDTVTVNITLDTVLPVISDISVTGITGNSALISWTTDEPTTSQVEYGIDITYGQATPLYPTLKTSHSVQLIGLLGLTEYHFRALSQDAATNIGQSDDQTFTTANPVPAPSLVYVNGTQLIVQKRNPDGTLQPPSPYIIRSVNWSPAGKDTATSPYDINNANVRRLEFGKWYETDIPLIKAMNVNTVRTFIDLGFDETLGPVGWEILDELYRNDIMVIMTVDDAINNLERVEGAVNYYKDHPAILMWSVGCEWNINSYYGVASSILDAAERTETAVAFIKTLDTNHPTVSSYGEIDISATGMRLSDTEYYVNDICPSVDVWSINVYRGYKFGSLFDQWESISSKPMFLGEFGVDAYDYILGHMDEAAQADWDKSLWDDIFRHLSALNPSDVALGGAAFEWNDEWWKVVPWQTHDTGGWPSGGFPDGWGNEEYFGVVDIDRQPREVYTTLTTCFDPSYIPPPEIITLKALSAGYSVSGYGGGIAEFSKDRYTFYSERGGAGDGRGFNIAVIDPTTGDVINPGQNFDTYITRRTGTEMYNMIDFINNDISDGQLVIIATCDEAGLNSDLSCGNFSYTWVEDGLQALEALGSTQIRNYCFRYSWAMIAIKGEGVAMEEALSTGTSDAVSIEANITVP